MKKELEFLKASETNGGQRRITIGNYAIVEARDIYDGVTVDGVFVSHFKKTVYEVFVLNPVFPKIGRSRMIPEPTVDAISKVIEDLMEEAKEDMIKMFKNGYNVDIVEEN